MKKKFLATFCALVLVILSLCACSAKDDTAVSAKDMTAVTLNEVAHSIFYAPQYAAIELGYFEEEGIDITLVTGFGADKTMTAVLSGEAEIGFMGSEGAT